MTLVHSSPGEPADTRSAPGHRARRVAFSSNSELALLGLWGVLTVLANQSPFLNGSTAVLILVCLSYSVILAMGIWLQLRKLSMMIWTPLVWFRIGCILFMGIGTIVPEFHSEEVRQRIARSFPYTPDDANRFMVLVIACTFSVLAVGRFFQFNVRGETSALRISHRARLLLLAILFLVVGGGFKYFVEWPVRFDVFDTAIPGWGRALGQSYYGGIMLLFLLAYGYRRRLLPIAYGLLIVEMLMGLLAFDKSLILIPFLFAMIGILSQGLSWTKILIGAAITGFVLTVLQPVVHYGRAFERDGRGLGVIERANILLSYDPSRSIATHVAVENPLLRLSYVGTGTWVMGLYDAGQPGTAHEHTFAALVPRVLWPGKPNVGAAGAEAYYLLRGRSGASLGVGHFAEAYWSFGWWGVPLVFIPGGILLCLMSYRTLSLLSRERWLQLPVVLLGVGIGYKVGGSWVPGVVGPFATFFVLSFLIAFVEAFASPARGVRRTAVSP